MPNYAAIALLAVCLSGCADMPWERSLYEGVRSSADQCRASARPGNAPCPTVPDYSRYEKERSRAKGD
ncbi:hypothetical protein SAMN05216303_101107 [Rhodoferax sp. OV413]|uniref:hypothetical protein n=1 Tax=Rhodoferax sp. OV413 TaxID=1855285 RepID=UPI00088E31E0|nr:hypothetical protein [Rhodoferax sp. OV413]SDN95339.1 hypothetical protein SAMN05216303_101107 [Rhodoferax sp. OV413]